MRPSEAVLFDSGNTPTGGDLDSAAVKLHAQESGRVRQRVDAFASDQRLKSVQVERAGLEAQGHRHVAKSPAGQPAGAA